MISKRLRDVDIFVFGLSEIHQYMSNSSHQTTAFFSFVQKSTLWKTGKWGKCWTGPCGCMVKWQQMLLGWGTWQRQKVRSDQMKNKPSEQTENSTSLIILLWACRGCHLISVIISDEISPGLSLWLTFFLVIALDSSIVCLPFCPQGILLLQNVRTARIQKFLFCGCMLSHLFSKQSFGPSSVGVVGHFLAFLWN